MTLSELTRPQYLFGVAGRLQSRLVWLLAHRHFLAGCLAAGIAIRLAWLALFAPQPVSDFRWYYERAIDLVAGRGYSVTAETYWPEYMIPPLLLAPADGRVPTAFWPVGYPAFLAGLFAVTGPSLLAAKLANVALYGGVLLLAYFIARRLFSPVVAGGTLLLLACYPDHIAYSSLLATEILFLFLLLLGVALLLLDKFPWTAAGAGIVFGLAGLVKPQAVLLPGLCLAALSVSFPRRRFFARDAAIVYLAVGLTVLPWLIRNAQVFGSFVFISNNAGYNLYVGNNPDATGGYSLTQSMIDRFANVPGEVERNRLALFLATDYVRHHPSDALALWPAKLWYLFGKDIRGAFWNEQGLPLNAPANNLLRPLKILGQLYYVAVIGAFLAALFVSWRNKTWPNLPPIGLWICGYFTAVHLVTFGESRFHFAMMPWVMMFAATLLLPKRPSTSVRDG